MNQAILEHIGRQHVDRAGIGMEGGEGIFGIGSVCRGEGVQRESKSAYGVHNVSEDWLSRGSFSTVRATAVGRDVKRNVVLAGDPKCLVYYVISTLNRTYLAGDLKRKG